MNDISTLQWITYFGVAFSIIMLVYRTVRIARLPVHLRWELYPIPHEKGKGHYGGSYMEEKEWWTRPRDVDKVAEIKEMAEEILFIKSLLRNNPGLWIFSFPFHLGLYLLVGFAGLMLLGAFLQVFDVAVSAKGGFGSAVHYATLVCGIGGIFLTLMGALGLLLKRFFDYRLRSFSSPADYFNLLITIFVSGSMLVAWWAGDHFFAAMRDYTQSLMLAAAYDATAPLVVEVLAVIVFLAYLPFTHMTHFIAKYFTYHDIKWADEPAIADPGMEEKMGKVLNYPVSWSARHIKGDGKKTWVDVATSLEEVKDGKK